MPNGVEFEGRVVHVGTFPIGIDPEKFRLGLQVQEVQARITRFVVGWLLIWIVYFFSLLPPLCRLREKFKGVKVLIGVDRLDYIKVNA